MIVATGRRKGATNSRTRALLIEAAEQILRDEGAGAVTARRLADQVGLGRHIVHYYFGTMDELFVALMREEGLRSEEWLKQAAKTSDALDLLWAISRFSGPIVFELTLLALRHPAIATEYKIYTERFRQTMCGILQDYAMERGIAFPTSSAAAALMLQSIAYVIAIEGTLELDMGHEAAEAALLGWLKGLSGSTALAAPWAGFPPVSDV